MKEVGKITKIVKGFFGDTVPEEVAEERRRLCRTCDFNSVNSQYLSIQSSIRNSFTGPFCTLCECQIHEKTGSPLEECAMYMIGEKKRWFKLKIETMGRDLDLINVGGTKADMKIEDNAFVIDFGEVHPLSDASIELLFSSKYNITFEKIVLTCGCTSSKAEQLDQNHIEVKLKLDVEKVGMGAGSKTLYLNYLDDGVSKSQQIKLKFHRTV